MPMLDYTLYFFFVLALFLSIILLWVILRVPESSSIVSKSFQKETSTPSGASLLFQL